MIIVSAGGGRWSTDTQSLRIRPGSEVIFYNQDDKPVSDHFANFVLHSLENQIKIGEPPEEIVRTGQVTFNYTCWKDGTLDDDCGIFDGESKKLYGFEHHDDGNSLYLSDIIDKHPGKTIYWLSDRNTYSVDEHSNDTLADVQMD